MSSRTSTAQSERLSHGHHATTAGATGINQARRHNSSHGLRSGRETASCCHPPTLGEQQAEILAEGATQHREGESHPKEKVDSQY